ncbi:MAG: O-acetylhomoserine aminocarboxypropyltransferase/cysteine synthase [Oscillospiraceae bacterium]|nr:O-acetylhomoserine aminocarboxypropyltransferase/cysteine synthase [Oscillospiraceae bacterium]
MAEFLNNADHTYKFETLQLHVGQEEADPATDSRAVPIYQTTSYVFKNCDHAAARFGLADAGNIYGRLTNSTQDVFERRIAALEGGVGALAVASGAAAISYTFQALAQAGDHIVAAETIYGGTYNFLAHTFPEFGVTTTFVNPDNVENFAKAIQPNTKAIFIESLGNPNSNLIDIEAVAKIAHDNKIPLVIDSTFATPYLLRPIEHGADIVVHSATKFIGGHGTTLGGVIIDSGKFDWEGSGKFHSLTDPNPSYHGISFTKAVGPAAFVTKIRAIYLRDTGATLSPFNAFLLLQGLETLSLRVERHVENALKVVDYLKNHPLVERVNHPSLPESGYKELYDRYFPNGAGSIFTFDIKGGAEAAKKFIDHLQVFSLLANVADVKSLVIHPASTTHSQLNEKELEEQGIHPGTIRLSIGTEHIDDIIYDLDQAFKAVEA